MRKITIIMAAILFCSCGYQHKNKPRTMPVDSNFSNMDTDLKNYGKN